MKFRVASCIQKSVVGTNKEDIKFRVATRIARSGMRTKYIINEVKKELLYTFSPSRPRKVMFDHLPKCGGASLRAYLRVHYLGRRTFETRGENPSAFVDKFRDFPQSKRYRYDLIMGHEVNGLIDFVHPECLKITVLRDPVDRIISNYYYMRSYPTLRLYSKIHESDMSLEDYVTSGLNPATRNWYTTHFSGLTVDEAEQNPEESINSAIKAILSRYDIIGFLDDLSSFIEELRDQAGLRYKFPDKRANVTRGRVSIDNVPESTINVIKKTNHLDTVLYGRIKDALGH